MEDKKFEASLQFFRSSKNWFFMDTDKDFTMFNLNSNLNDAYISVVNEYQMLPCKDLMFKTDRFISIWSVEDKGFLVSFLECGSFSFIEKRNNLENPFSIDKDKFNYLDEIQKKEVSQLCLSLNQINPFLF